MYDLVPPREIAGGNMFHPPRSSRHAVPEFSKSCQVFTERLFLFRFSFCPPFGLRKQSRFRVCIYSSLVAALLHGMGTNDARVL